MPAILRTSLFLTILVVTTVIYGCGGDSSNVTVTPIEETNTETTDRNDAALQGTVWKFSQFHRSDGSINSIDQSYADNFIYLAPFTDSFRGNYGCSVVHGVYSLNRNDLSVTEQEVSSIECDMTATNYESNLALIKRVLTGPSTLSVSNDVLTLLSDSNESLIFVAGQEK